MCKRKPVLVFDVIETIFSLNALTRALSAEGLPTHTKDLFFAQLLRDAFASSATGCYVPFVDMARGTLEVLLHTVGGVNETKHADTIIDRILPVFGQLDAHLDVEDALGLAKERGVDVLFFTNGSEQNTRSLIARNGLINLVDHVVSIDTFRRWKPARSAYESAISQVDGAPEQSAMIAAHAWDTSGARNAGLLTGWIQRQDALFHPAMPAPCIQSNSLVTLVDQLSGHLLAAK